MIQEVAKLQKQVKAEYDQTVSELRRQTRDKEIENSILLQDLSRNQAEVEELKKIAFCREGSIAHITAADLNNRITFEGMIPDYARRKEYNSVSCEQLLL